MSRRPPGGLLVVVIAATAVGLPSVAQAEPVRTRLAAAGLLPERAAFAELSIKQYDALFTTVTYDGEVSFDVLAANTSTRARTYTWTATVGPQDAPKPVGNGRISLAAGATKQVAIHFRIPDCLQRNRISVRLTSAGARATEVHYWVLPHGSAAWKQSGGPNCGV